MSGRPKQPAVTDAETARQLTRELHAAIKDARTAEREIGEAIGEWTDNAGKMKDVAHKLLDDLADQVTSEIRGIGDLVREHADELTRNHAEVLGMKTPDEVIGLIAANVVELLRPAVVRMVEARMPGIVAAQLSAAGRIADLIMGAPEPAGTGATGAVPGRPGHQS
jgi:phage host-nuclease inhibitor protein Gam